MSSNLNEKQIENDLKLKIARNMIIYGYETIIISKIVELPIEEVEQVHNELTKNKFKESSNVTELEHERSALRSKEKYERSLSSAREEAYNEAYIEKKTKIMHSLINSNFPDELIAEIVEFPIEIVKQYKENLSK